MAETLHIANNGAGTAARSFRLGTSPIGASFETLHGGWYLNTVKVKLYRFGSPGGTLTVSVYATDGAGKPTGSPLGSNTMAANSVATTPGAWYSFAVGSIYMAGQTKYAIVCDLNAGNGSNFLNWWYTTALSDFIWALSYSGGVWQTPQTQPDSMFEAWGTGPVATLGTVSSPQAHQVTGSFTIDDITNIDDWGFDWRTYGGSYTAGQEVTAGSAPTVGANNIAVTGLNPATLYYFRAKFHHTSLGWITVGYSGREATTLTTHDTSLTRMIYNSAVDNAQESVHASSNYRWGQVFTPTTSFMIKSVSLKLSRAGALSSANFYVAIRATSAGHPTGGNLLLVTRPSSFLTTTPTWYEFGLGDGILLTAGVSYAIWVYSDYGDASNFPWWRYYNGVSQFAGNRWSSTDDINWVDRGVADFMIDVYGLPNVMTYPASEITYTQAVGNGFIADISTIDELGFEWGQTLGGPYPDDITVTGIVSSGLFSDLMTGLADETLYYYRAKAHDTIVGWYYGNEESFTTLLATPQVATNNPSDVGTSYIVAQGEIEAIGGSTPDVRGFVYGLTSQSDPGNVAPSASSYDSYTTETGSFGVGVFLKVISSLTANKRYYVRAYAHNSFGYSYGDELLIYTGSTVNILYPIYDYSKGIRFDTSPGGGTPYGGIVPHAFLTQDEDSEFHDGGYFGWVTGNYVYERDWYNGNMYTDLYSMSNPSRRTEGIIKLKYKARLLKNGYPYGHWQRHLMTHGVDYTGTKSDISFGNPNQCEIFYDNPYTGGDWTLAEADAIIAGVSLGEAGGFGVAICDALKVVVLWANAYARTDPSNYLSPTSFRLNGYVTEDESEACEVWFQWGPTSGFGSVTSHQDKAKGESFLADITASGEIYFRTVIETVCGETFYGNTRTTTQQPITLPLRGLFTRGDEIQATFSVSGISRPYRSPDFGATWYPVAGMDDVHTGDVGFDSRNVQNSFFGGSGHLYVFDNADGETFEYVQGAAITGDVDQVDVDLDLPIALIATNLKLYKTVDWGHVVYEMLNQPIRDVAFGGVSLAPETQIELLTPTGDGEYRQLTPVPSTPTTHYDKVLDADSKKAYNPQGGYGGYGEWGYNGRLADTYFFTNLRGEGTINNITVYVTLGVASALMSRNFILRLNGVNYFSGFSTVAGGTISYTWATNPATGNPWQKSEIQNGTFQAGVIISDTGVPSGCWIDKIWIVVDWA